MTLYPPPANVGRIAYDIDGLLQSTVTTPDEFGTSQIVFDCVACDTYWIQANSYDYPPDSDNPSAGYPRSDCVLRWSVT